MNMEWGQANMKIIINKVHKIFFLEITAHKNGKLYQKCDLCNRFTQPISLATGKYVLVSV